MPRAIIRWSINNELSNETGRAISETLNGAGFIKTGTALYESQDGDLDEVVRAIRTVLDCCVNTLGGGHLDNIWIYIDQAEPPPPGDPIWREVQPPPGADEI